MHLSVRLYALVCLAALLGAVPAFALATEFSVTPIRAELKPGQLSETFTVANQSKSRLRVAIKLMEWTQDAQGNDQYADSNDLIYFPRQLEIEPEGKRLVRLGLRAQAGTLERTYRLFIEEQPDPSTAAGSAQVAFYFRFGAPVFVAPPQAKPDLQAGPLALQAGKLAVKVSNKGTKHVRLNRVTFSDGQGYSQEVLGWYSLAGSERVYAAEVPAEACGRARQLQVVLEGDNLRIDRTLDVDPASCR